MYNAPEHRSAAQDLPPYLTENRRTVFVEGMKAGIPIALGYFVVSFTLGIIAKTAGLTPWQGFWTSFLNNASAGEYAAFTVIAAKAPYVELAVLTLVANARYLLMSAALTQKYHPATPLYHRLLVAFDVTDEIFGITVARKGYLNPYYNYGAMALALPSWAGGTMLGIIAGGTLPASIISALSVALYGMFIWVIVPTARCDFIVARLIGVSFVLSLLFTQLPLVSELSAGVRIIVLTVAIAGIGAYLYPITGKESA